LSIRHRYLSAFAREAGRFAIWEPGSPAAVGDYGEFKAGEFHKLGNLSSLGVSFDEEASNLTHWEFTSEGVASAQMDLRAEASIGQLGIANAGLQISFARENSLFVRAANSRWTQIANLRILAGILQEDERWEFRWRLVVGLREADSLIVLLSTQAGARVLVQGEAPALQQFQLGAVGARAGVSITGGGTYNVTDIAGPLLMQVVKIRRFPLWRSAVKYSTGEMAGVAIEPFVELDPVAELSTE
jgi:hypothetical protein